MAKFQEIEAIKAETLSTIIGQQDNPGPTVAAETDAILPFPELPCVGSQIKSQSLPPRKSARDDGANDQRYFKVWSAPSRHYLWGGTPSASRVFLRDPGGDRWVWKDHPGKGSS